MGQAVADLPDPLDSVLSPPANVAGTDDLLSQLAGDEIDRLLAEADAGTAAPVPPAAAPPADLAASFEPMPEVELPVGFAPTPAPAVAAVAATAATPAGAPSAAPVAAAAPVPAPPAPAAGPEVPVDELDALLNELNQGLLPAAPASVAPPASPAAATPAAAPVTAEPPAAPKSLTDQVPDVLAQFGTKVIPPSDKIPTPDDHLPSPVPPASPAAAGGEGLMSSAERDALSLASLADATDAAERDDAAAAAAAAKAAPKAVAPRSPGRAGRLAIRMLELLNAPAAAVPDTARDLLGKVGIITLVNSLAVLIYVIFFRR